MTINRPIVQYQLRDTHHTDTGTEYVRWEVRAELRFYDTVATVRSCYAP